MVGHTFNLNRRDRNRQLSECKASLVYTTALAKATRRKETERWGKREGGRKKGREGVGRSEGVREADFQ